MGNLKIQKGLKFFFRRTGNYEARKGNKVTDTYL